MAAGTTPIFPAAVNTTAAKAVTADSSRTTPTTGGVTIFTAGSNGSRLDKVFFCAVASTTAGDVRLFLYDASAYYLWKEINYPTITASTSVAPWQYTLVESLVLKTGWTVIGTSDNGDDIHMIASGGDY